MTNKEKYANKIIELAANAGVFVLKNGEPALCKETKCEDCDFNKLNSCKCSEYKFREWLNSEYVESPVDWSKVAVDTPILVKDVKSGNWNRRYFAKYENGMFYAWADGATSWSVPCNADMTRWKMAKLAESEE